MNKPIKFSFHAMQRRKQRGMSENLIIVVIENPDYFKKLSDGRKIAVKTIQTRTVSVVYREEESFIKVITVF